MSSSYRKLKDTEFLKFWQPGIESTSMVIATVPQREEGKEGVGLAMKEIIVKRPAKTA